MFKGLTILLIFQLIGDMLARTLELPIPGPVIGMILLFSTLIIRGGVPKDLKIAVDIILPHLSLFFIPAGVGVISFLAILHQYIVLVIIALFFSTWCTMVITGWAWQLLNKRASND